MKILLAIFSCHSYMYTAEGMRDWFTRTTVDRVSAVRDSWLKDVQCDYKIFKGRRIGIRDTAVHIRPSDEVWLDAIDDYHHSAEKIRALIKYALDNGYDYVCKVDDDVYVYYDRLMANAPTADYVGSDRGESLVGLKADFCPGFTYWLSRRAMELLDKSPAGTWAEDRWIGEALKKQQIRCAFDNRYHLVRPTRTNPYISDGELEQTNNFLTIHALSPDQMRRHYADRGRDALQTK
jgi:hypothetical protein